MSTAATYSESRNIAPISGTATINNRSTSVSGFANKAEGRSWLRNISSISVCAHRWATFSRKAKILKASAMPTVKYIDVGAYYYFNKNMSTYVDYKINQLDSNNKLGLKDDNVIAVALTYQF